MHKGRSMYALRNVPPFLFDDSLSLSLLPLPLPQPLLLVEDDPHTQSHFCLSNICGCFLLLLAFVLFHTHSLPSLSPLAYLLFFFPSSFSSSRRVRRRRTLPSQLPRTCIFAARLTFYVFLRLRRRRLPPLPSCLPAFTFLTSSFLPSLPPSSLSSFHNGFYFRGIRGDPGQAHPVQGFRGVGRQGTLEG